MDVTQILLLVVITILSLVLTVVFIQVYFILKEARRGVQKLNKIIDDGAVVSNVFSRSIGGVSQLLTGVKTGLSIINIFKRTKSEDDDGE